MAFRGRRDQVYGALERRSQKTPHDPCGGEETKKGRPLGRPLMVELRGFEPLTFSMRTRRATNCAIAPPLLAERGTEYHLVQVALKCAASAGGFGEGDWPPPKHA